MDQLQWNVSGFCTWFPDLQDLIKYCDPLINWLQEPYIHPCHALNVHGFVLHHYDHISSDRGNKRLAIILLVPRNSSRGRGVITSLAELGEQSYQLPSAWVLQFGM
jgi:hypothetical protein